MSTHTTHSITHSLTHMLYSFLLVCSSKRRLRNTTTSRKTAKLVHMVSQSVYALFIHSSMRGIVIQMPFVFLIQIYTFICAPYNPQTRLSRLSTNFYLFFFHFSILLLLLLLIYSIIIHPTHTLFLDAHTHTHI